MTKRAHELLGSACMSQEDDQERTTLVTQENKIYISTYKKIYMVKRLTTL